MNWQSLSGFRRSCAGLGFSLGLGALLAAAAPGRADTIVSTFSDVTRGGFLLTYDGLILTNNFGAVYGILNDFGPASRVTGEQLQGSQFSEGEPFRSSLIFLGAPVPADPSQTFTLGSLLFANERNTPESVIFNVKLSLAVSPDNYTVPPGPTGSTGLNLFTTLEYLSDPASEGRVPDFLSLTSVPGRSLQVEEGYYGVIDLFGRIVGSTIEITGIGPSSARPLGATPAPGLIQDFDYSVEAVPETSNLLAGLAVAGLIGYECFRRRRGPATA